jgi:hypothetical protein
MSAQPLTHHEILGLVEPFTRLGLKVDLPASDRAVRRLVFRTVEVASAAGADGATLRETLRLENPAAGEFRLTRGLVHPSGLEATLEVRGPHPGALLARIAGVDPTTQFSVEDGLVIARSYRLRGDAGTEREFTLATLQVMELKLTLRAPLASGAPAEIDLLKAPDDPLALPEDLLAVLGWDFGLLRRIPGGWRSALRVRGREPGRSQRAERAALTLGRHLVRTLRASPAEFHSTRALARWGVAFRRALPVLVSAGLIGGVALLPRLHIAEDSALRMLFFNLPPVLLVLVFCMREIPPFEIPAPPRPLLRPHWREPGLPR